LDSFTIAILVVAVALFFDYCNGAHDSSNIVVTMVSSRAISPYWALMIAALFEFTGAYFLGTAVAETIGKGIVNPEIIKVTGSGIIIVFAALIAAISWNLFTWYFGIPTSSSHALIGGLLGAFVVARGFSIVNWNRVAGIILVLVASPLAGLLLGFLFTRIVYFFSQWCSPRANALFKRLQLGASVLLALSHGTNDAQKTMGVITFSLVVLRLYHPPSRSLTIPRWIVVACAGTIALGILTGGWRIINTLGGKLYRIRAIHGLTAQSSSAIIIYAAAIFGFPVSTTQVVTSTIMGAGSAERPKGVRWEVIREILITWLVTIPVVAMLSMLIYLVINKFL
jgi:PiT family inorganic phosphate transporter